MKNLIIILLLFSCGVNDINPDTCAINNEPCITTVSLLNDDLYLKNPHDAIVDKYNPSIAYVSGKGHHTKTTVDGSFGIVDISNPLNPVVLGGYAGKGNQPDGETVLQLSPTRVLHFVDKKVHLFDVSNPSNVIKVKTVIHDGGSVNGAVQIGNYVFGANKGGYINVFDVSDIDNYFLVGSYADGVNSIYEGPHDIDADGEHIYFVNRQFKRIEKIKVFDCDKLIPIQNWVLTAQYSNNTILEKCNRLRIGNDTIFAHGKFYVSSYDKNLNLIKSIPVDDFSAGSEIYNNKLIATYGVGFKILDFNLNEQCDFYDNITFSIGTNINFHDCPMFTVNGQNYLLMTVQNANQVAIFRIP